VSEITEFLVFCSALRDTPGTLRSLGLPPGDPEVLRAMIEEDRRAIARLGALLSGSDVLPGDLPPIPPGHDLLATFEKYRERLLELLETVDATTLHATGRLPSGRELDPWRLAGNLADHDVRCLGRLRR